MLTASSMPIMPPATLRSMPPLSLIHLMKTTYPPTLLTAPSLLHFLPTDHHNPMGFPPGPGPKTLALDRRRMPPPPPRPPRPPRPPPPPLPPPPPPPPPPLPSSGGLTLLQSCVITTPFLDLLPRNGRTMCLVKKMYCEVAALSGGFCLHYCFLSA